LWEADLRADVFQISTTQALFVQCVLFFKAAVGQNFLNLDMKIALQYLNDINGNMTVQLHAYQAGKGA